MLDREVRDQELQTWVDKLQQALAMPDGKERYELIGYIVNRINPLLMHELDSVGSSEIVSHTWLGP